MGRLEGLTLLRPLLQSPGSPFYGLRRVDVPRVIGPVRKLKPRAKAPFRHEYVLEVEVQAAIERLGQ